MCLASTVWPIQDLPQGSIGKWVYLNTVDHGVCVQNALCVRNTFLCSECFFNVFRMLFLCGPAKVAFSRPWMFYV